VATDRDAQRKVRLREAIAAYLLRHPLAGDTREGILACWLPDRGYEDAGAHLDDVLEAMLDANELVARELPARQVLYVRGPKLG
jgi:hypothetical protein